MRVRQTPRGGRRGFTLVELIITIAIGAVLLTSIGLAAQVHFSTLVQNRDFLVAYNLGRRQMAIMMNEPYPAVMTETAQTADPDFPDFIPTQEVTTVDTSGSDSLRHICVRIRHGSSSGPILVEVHAYRSNILSFGDGV